MAFLNRTIVKRQMFCEDAKMIEKRRVVREEDFESKRRANARAKNLNLDITILDELCVAHACSRWLCREKNNRTRTMSNAASNGHSENRASYFEQQRALILQDIGEVGYPSHWRSTLTYTFVEFGASFTEPQ